MMESVIRLNLDGNYDRFLNGALVTTNEEVAFIPVIGVDWLLENTPYNEMTICLSLDQLRALIEVIEQEREAQ